MYTPPSQNLPLYEERLRFLRAASRRPEIGIGRALYEMSYLWLKAKEDQHEELVDEIQCDLPFLFRREAARLSLDMTLDPWADRFHFPGIEWQWPPDKDYCPRWVLSWPQEFAQSQFREWRFFLKDDQVADKVDCAFGSQNFDPGGRFANIFPRPETPEAPRPPVWDLRSEDEKEYRKRVQSWVGKDLEEYIDAQKRTRSAALNSRVRRVPIELRYEWAALRVCLRWTYETIAGTFSSRDSLSPQAVQQHVTRICGFIGLEAS